MFEQAAEAAAALRLSGSLKSGDVKLSHIQVGGAGCSVDGAAVASARSSHVVANARMLLPRCHLSLSSLLYSFSLYFAVFLFCCFSLSLRLPQDSLRKLPEESRTAETVAILGGDVEPLPLGTTVVPRRAVPEAASDDEDAERRRGRGRARASRASDDLIAPYNE